MRIDCKNKHGNYQLIRQLGFENEEFYFGILPCDIEWQIDNWMGIGYEVGLFDIKQKTTIFKSKSFKGHEDYNGISTN